MLAACIALLSCGCEKDASEQAKQHAQQLVGSYDVSGIIYLDAWIGGGSDYFHYSGNATATYNGNATLKIRYHSNNSGDDNNVEARVDNNGNINLDKISIKKNGFKMTATTTSSSIHRIAQGNDTLRGSARCVLKILGVERTAKLDLTAVQIR